MGKNGVTVNGILHTPSSAPQQLYTQDFLQVGEQKFFFLLPKGTSRSALLVTSLDAMARRSLAMLLPLESSVPNAFVAPLCSAHVTVKALRMMLAVEQYATWSCIAYPQHEVCTQSIFAQADKLRGVVMTAGGGLQVQVPLRKLSDPMFFSVLCELCCLSTSYFLLNCTDCYAGLDVQQQTRKLSCSASYGRATPVNRSCHE